MPVAGAVKFDVIAQAQDRVKATLRSVNRELSKTQAKLSELNRTSDDEAQVQEIIRKAKQRRIAQLTAERRAAVQTARAQKQQTNALTGFLAKAERLDRMRSRFEMIRGIAMAAVPAFVGLVTVIDKARENFSEYGQAIAEANNRQERFNELTGEIKTLLDEQAKSRLTEEQRELVELAEKRLGASEKFVENQTKIDILTRAHAAAEAEVNDLKELSNTSMVAQLGNLERLKEAQRERGRLAGELTAAQEQQVALEREALGLAQQLAVQVAQRVFGVFSLLKASAEAQKTVAKNLDAERKAKAAAAVAAAKAARQRRRAEADRVASLRAQVDVMQAQDIRTGVQIQLRSELARIERELGRETIGQEEARLQAIVAQEQAKKKLADLDRAAAEAQKRASEAAAREAAAEERKRARQAREKARAVAEGRKSEADNIRGVAAEAAAALGPLREYSKLLGGLAEVGRDSSDIWADYAAGQKDISGALREQVGVMGAAIASQIKDKQAAALVYGAFEVAQSAAAFAAQNYAAGVAHAAAAALFFGVAATSGGGKKGASAGGGAGGQAPAGRSRGRGTFGSANDNGGDGRDLTIVQLGSGIVYGLGSEVAKAAHGADRALDKTGMRRRSF